MESEGQLRTGEIRVRRASAADIERLLPMRMRLWPDCPADEHRLELQQWMDSPEETPVFIAEDTDGNPVGFVEASIHDSASGCKTTPVGYVEGWFIEEKHRRLGIGRMLIALAEEWARDRGFREMASDAEIDNKVSISAHLRLGYVETHRAGGEVKFMKMLT